MVRLYGAQLLADMCIARPDLVFSLLNSGHSTMPYILVDNSECWKQRGWDWGGLERIGFNPANSETPKFMFQWDSSTQKWFRYNVRACLRGTELRIEYRKDDNPDLKEYEIIYGEHILKDILTIENGATEGRSVWRTDTDPKSCDGPGWRLEAISGELTNRRRGTIWAIQRGQQGEFRQQLLAMDTCCAVTGETCESVLEAAHIVPAHKGGCEVPSNGILLRADIHRLFDSNPPRFEICPADGHLVPISGFRYASANLEGAQIPQSVHERIAQALEMRSTLFGAK